MQRKDIFEKLDYWERVAMRLLLSVLFAKGIWMVLAVEIHPDHQSQAKAQVYQLPIPTGNPPEEIIRHLEGQTAADQSSERTIVVVISDGTPLQEATLPRDSGASLQCSFLFLVTLSSYEASIEHTPAARCRGNIIAGQAALFPRAGTDNAESLQDR